MSDKLQFVAPIDKLKLVGRANLKFAALQFARHLSQGNEFDVVRLRDLADKTFESQ